jgi:hypothetical protein
LGFVAGALFSVLLAIAESRVGSRRMAAPRFLIWGSVAGIAMGAATTLIPGWTMSGATAVLFLLSGGSVAQQATQSSQDHVAGTRLQPIRRGKAA